MSSVRPSQPCFQANQNRLQVILDPHAEDDSLPREGWFNINVNCQEAVEAGAGR